MQDSNEEEHTGNAKGTSMEKGQVIVKHSMVISTSVINQIVVTISGIYHGFSEGRYE